VLVVLSADDGIADRSFANLQQVQTLQVTELNAHDVIRSDWVVFTDDTLPGETETLAPAAKATSAAKAPVAKATSGAKRASATTKKAAAKPETEVEASTEEPASEEDET
jgi:hypothetical protein